MLIIGCDFHTRYQQIAMADDSTGELLCERRLENENGEAEAFYRSLPKPVRVGIEATHAWRLDPSWVAYLAGCARMALPRSAFLSADRIDSDQPGLIVGIETEAAPWPIRRRLDELIVREPADRQGVL
jgi:hypothetical protein